MSNMTRDWDHDAGLEHPHDWAREWGAHRRNGPTVADAASVPTPSSAVHDDAHYAHHG